MKAKVLIYQLIFVCIHPYGYQIQIMTERMRLRILTVDMSFLQGVAGLFFSSLATLALSSEWD